MSKLKGGSGRGQGRKSPWEEKLPSRISVPYELADPKQTAALAKLWSMLQEARLDLADFVSTIQSDGINLFLQSDPKQTAALAKLWSMLQEARLDLADFVSTMQSDGINLFLQSEANQLDKNPQPCRIYSTAIAASFGVVSPSDADAGGYEEIELSSLLIKVPERTILLEVTGNSMVDEGIFPGSILIVETTNTTNKSWLQAETGDIVVARIENANSTDLTVKRFERNAEGEFLVPRNRRNKNYQPIRVGGSDSQGEQEQKTSIIGIVKKIIQDV